MPPRTHNVSAAPSPIRTIEPRRPGALRRWRDGVLTAAAFALVLGLVFGTVGGGQIGASAPADPSRLAEVSLSR